MGDALFAWVFLMTAAPASVLLNLRLSGLDGQECTLTAGSALRRPAVLPVPDFMAEFLSDFAATHGVIEPDEHVFVIPGADGDLQPMTLEYVQTLFSGLAAAVTLPGVRLSLDGLHEHAVVGLATDMAMMGTPCTRHEGTTLAACMVDRWGGGHPWLHSQG